MPDDLAGGPGRSRSRARDGRVVDPLPVGRAVVVLALFVVVTAALLGKVGATPVASRTGRSGAPVPRPAAAHAPATTVPPTTTTTIPPSSVTVLVANGTQVNGLAGRTTTTLKADGWGTLAAVNATAQVTKSMVYYVAGFEQPAAAVAAALGLASGIVAPYTAGVPVATVGSAKVVVVAGPDLASPATTTTTAPPTTTARHG